MCRRHKCNVDIHCLVRDRPDQSHTGVLSFRCRGRGDGLLAVGDGGQAPVTFALCRSRSIPQHPTMPASHPVRDPHRPKLHTGNTDELRGGQARAGVQERRQFAASLPPPHTPGARHSPARNLGTEKVETLTDCVMNISS